MASSAPAAAKPSFLRAASPRTNASPLHSPPRTAALVPPICPTMQAHNSSDTRDGFAARIDQGAAAAAAAAAISESALSPPMSPIELVNVPLAVAVGVPCVAARAPTSERRQGLSTPKTTTQPVTRTYQIITSTNRTVGAAPSTNARKPQLLSPIPLPGAVADAASFTPSPSSLLQQPRRIFLSGAVRARCPAAATADTPQLFFAAQGAAPTPYITSPLSEECCAQWTEASAPIKIASTANSSSCATAAASSCLPANTWDQTSPLQSPLSAALHPLAGEELTRASASVDRMTPLLAGDDFSCNSPPRELDTTAVGQQQTILSICSAQDTEREAGGSWDAKRVRPFSAARRSRDIQPFTSPSVSAMSFSATLGSPHSETRSNSISGRGTAWVGNRGGTGRASGSGAAADFTAPYWTSLPPANRSVASLSSPVLPRTPSAPAVLTDPVPSSLNARPHC